MKINNSTAKELKNQFPIFNYNKNLIYLDNAATTQKPDEVIRVIENFYRRDYANIHRGVYRLSEKATELYNKSKEIVANFINAKPEEIVYTRNTTESLNLLANSIKPVLKRGRKEIVLTEMEHHSNILPWQKFAKENGFKLRYIKVDKETFGLDLKDISKKITNKTALVAITHISNSLGTENNVEEIFKLAKEKEAITILDAAQSISRVSLDVEKLNCDFLAFSGHKAFGPTGIGVLYGKKELLEKMPPFLRGGEMIKKVTWRTAKWANPPEKFEAGTPNIVGAIGLGKAIKFLEKINPNQIGAWEKKLADYTIEKLSEIPNLELYIPKNYSGILSFNLNGAHPHDVATLLDTYGITIRAGHHCNMPLITKLKLGKKATCRISFSLYNTFQDIDNLAKALKEISNKFN